MAKKKSFPKCPACKKDIKNHKKADALECVEKLGLEPLDDIFMLGRKHANLKSWGQKDADRNIMTLQFGRRFVKTIMPEFDILHEVLEAQAKENNDGKKDSDDEGSKGSSGKSGEDS